MVDVTCAVWRLLLSTPADGAANMAIDEAIWQAVVAGRVLPTLRLYAWMPPCLSLGRNQPLADVRPEALQAAGWGLVRRPTGGRAILHADELTYSVVLPLDDPRVTGDVLSSCRRLSAGLIEGLRLLRVGGVEARLRQQRPSTPSAVCFQEAGDFEVTVGGRKLLGSAQMRARGVLLQHGALPLTGDMARICAVLSAPSVPERVRARAVTLADVLDRPVTWDETAAAMAAGMARALNLQWEKGELTVEESSAARELVEQKYNSAGWTARC